MNIYFACSITGGRRYENIYQSISHYLLEEGHIVPTAHLAQSNVMKLEKIVDAEEIYSRDVGWIKDCDTLVAEISTPSHGVGFEIGFALNNGKPVLCLHKTGINVSKMITGNPNPLLIVASYSTTKQAISILQKHLDCIS